MVVDKECLEVDDVFRIVGSEASYDDVGGW